MRNLTICYIRHTAHFWDSTLSLSGSSRGRIALRPFVTLAFLSMGNCVDVSQMNRFLSVDSPVSTL